MIAPIHTKVITFSGSEIEGFEGHWNLWVYHSDRVSTTPICYKKIYLQTRQHSSAPPLLHILNIYISNAIDYTE